MSGVPSWAVRGTKVVCVENRPSGHSLGWNIAVGAIYTIRKTHFAIDEWHVAVSEFVNADTGEGPFWPLARFRPLVEPKSEVEDVALFKHHLDQRQGVDA